MAEFASEHLQHQGVIEAGGSISIPFGPPTPGLIIVFLEAQGLLFAPPPPRPQNTTPGQPGIIIARTNDNRFHRAGLGVLDIFDPGGGFDPPPPSPPVDLNALRLELLDADGHVRATQMGARMMTFELPAPVVSVTAPAHGAAFGLPRSWKLRITNTGAVKARLTTQLIFQGQRPIVSREINLDFINEKLDLLFNVPQPISISFENRLVPLVRPPGGPLIQVYHTFVVLTVDEAWRTLYPMLETRAHDLGALVFPKVTFSSNVTVSATLHDGALAFRVRVEFPSFKGQINGIEVIRALGHGGVATVADIFTDIDITIRTLRLDLFLVLRPEGIFLQPAPTFEVVARPLLQLEPEKYEPMVDGLLQLAFERFLPEAAGDALRAGAAKILGWLLGDLGRTVTGSSQTFALQYAGDPPRPVEKSSDTAVVSNVVKGPFEPGNLAKIDHIVVVMMENRSFDHMLGFLSLPTSGNDGRIGMGRTDIDGLQGHESNPRDFSGGRQRVFSLATPRQGDQRPAPQYETRGTKFPFSPGHSYRATGSQRGDYPITVKGPFGEALEVPVGAGEGFVFDFARSIGSLGMLEEELLAGEIMGYHPAEHVPMYRFLAEQYTVCDKWFTSHPGPTLPNRFVTLTGRLATDANGFPQVNNPNLAAFDPLDIPTIFDHLTARGIDWRYFEKDFGVLRFFSKYTFDMQHVVDIDDASGGFFARAQRGQLPPVVFIDPDFADLPPGNDDQPPSDIAAGQQFIRKIYDALAGGPREQWLKTLLIVVYDEHGGFFDHVTPQQKPLFDSQAPERGGFVPLGVDPETHAPIDHYGFRVPAFVISPWVPARSVSSEEFDHTSILKTIIARFMPQNAPDMGLRVALAKDVGPLLSLASPRVPTIAPAVHYTPTGREAFSSRSGPVPEDDDLRGLLAGVRARVRVREVTARR